MHRIVILNPKGGSGKTTVATNLAAYFAASGRPPTLIDLDPQGSSVRWSSKRPKDSPPIHVIAGAERYATVTRSWLLRIPAGCEIVILDTPAAVDPARLPELTRGADSILIPVMPSEIDIHATAKCVADLLLVAKIKREDNRLGIIANRVRTHTVAFQSLRKFLESLDIPLLATLRDAQNYVRSSASGLGVFDLPQWQARDDVATWNDLLEWLEAKQAGAERRLQAAETSNTQT